MLSSAQYCEQHRTKGQRGQANRLVTNPRLCGEGISIRYCSVVTRINPPALKNPPYVLASTGCLGALCRPLFSLWRRFSSHSSPVPTSQHHTGNPRNILFFLCTLLLPVATGSDCPSPLTATARAFVPLLVLCGRNDPHVEKR